MAEWLLYINDRFTGVAVRSDEHHPEVYRIHADGRISDLVNLTRAKEAALTWTRPRGCGGKEVARWQYRETPSERATCDKLLSRSSGPHPACFSKWGRA